MDSTLHRWRVRGIVTAIALVAAGCGGGAAPSAPSVSVAPTFSVTGIVRDSSSASGAEPVSGARVEVVDGPFAGKSTESDNQGVYRLFVLSGSFRLRVTKDGYSATTTPVGPLAGNVTVEVKLARLAIDVSGRVTQSAPTDGVGIGDARLQILSGSESVAAVLSSADGTFVLKGLTTAADIAVHADGYEDRTIRIDPTLSPAGVNIPLMPVSQIIVDTIGRSGGPPMAPTSFFREVHHSGSIVVSQFYFYYSQDPTNPPTRTVEIWDGQRLVAAASVNKQQWFAIALDAHVDGGRRYEIRLAGGPWSTVTIAVPN